MDLILASTSPYRRDLLERLQLPFTCIAPETDECPLPGESPRALAGRLALAKARAVAMRHPADLVIGSDQVACIAGEPVGKPGSHEKAALQLRASSGGIVEFFTGLALSGRDAGIEECEIVAFRVHFRPLSEAMIEDYLHREKPYDCAGSFMCEGLGIALFSKMEGSDPTALQGLPLITLTSMLQRAGVPVLMP